MRSTRFNGLERLDPFMPSVVSSNIYPAWRVLPGKPYVTETTRQEASGKNGDRYLQLPALR